jgi:hypothetical protein
MTWITFFQQWHRQRVRHEGMPTCQTANLGEVLMYNSWLPNRHT